MAGRTRIWLDRQQPKIRSASTLDPHSTQRAATANAVSCYEHMESSPSHPDRMVKPDSKNAHMRRRSVAEM